MTTLDFEDLELISGGAAYDPSKSDGCSAAPDGTWRQACVDHDAAYFKGGSAADRLAADKKLRSDMIKQGAAPVVADLYYAAVRIGGMPGTHLPWQWGMGKGK
jgi:hypothetical protein